MQYLSWLDNVSYPMLIFAAVLMGLAPFVPMPHLWEKIIMLKNGDLKKPIDIFDLFWHLVPVFILVLKVIRDRNSVQG